MTTLFICRGLPASGKSSWSRHIIDSSVAGKIIRINRDDLRSSMLPTGYAQSMTRPGEDAVTAVQHAGVFTALIAGIDVIVDDTNLRARTTKELVDLAVRAGTSWECVDHFFDVGVEVCIARDKLRPYPVGEQRILDMHKKYLTRGPLKVPELTPSVFGDRYVPKPGMRSAIIVDIDGTVAIHEPHRSPYDTSLYHLDTPNVNVVSAVYGEMLRGAFVLFCSGRDEKYRGATEKWISEHVIPESFRSRWSLLMRPEDDKRNDAVVKLELFDEYIRDYFDVLRVYDDRDRVVSMWRSLGLTCLQVGDGSF